MTIISTFFSGRAGVRAAKAELGGKIIDNGAGAPKDQRWELQYDAGAGMGKSQIVAVAALKAGAAVESVKLAEVEELELAGLPSVGATSVPDLAGADLVVLEDVSSILSTDQMKELVKEATEVKSVVLDEIESPDEVLEAVAAIERDVLKAPKGLRYSGTRVIVLADKKKEIPVTVKRSTFAARLAAHMAK